MDTSGTVQSVTHQSLICGEELRHFITFIARSRLSFSILTSLDSLLPASDILLMVWPVSFTLLINAF